MSYKGRSPVGDMLETVSSEFTLPVYAASLQRLDICHAGLIICVSFTVMLSTLFHSVNRMHCSNDLPVCRHLRFPKFFNKICLFLEHVISELKKMLPAISCFMSLV